MHMYESNAFFDLVRQPSSIVDVIVKGFFSNVKQYLDKQCTSAIVIFRTDI